MAIVYQSGSTTEVLVANGNTMIVYDYAIIGTSVGSGVELAAGPVFTSVVNFGDIIGPEGIDVNADVSMIVNHGQIQSVSGDAIDLGGTGGRNYITNLGTIQSTGYFINTLWSIDPIDVHLSNSGRIVTDGSALIYDAINLDDVYVSNTGTMRGGEIGMSGSGIARLFNSGTVEAAMIDMDADAGAIFLNHGLITGYDEQTTILLSDWHDTAVNSGTIFGRLDLGAGTDRYEAVGSGTVSGSVFGSFGNDTLVGGSEADTLQGDIDDDWLIGRGGDDFLYGGHGYDLMLGGTGYDAMHGGTYDDTLNGNQGDDSLYGDQGNDLLVGQDGSDLIYGGTENDTIDGGVGGDTLEGEAGNDILRGRAGEDDLAGGPGRDFLTGGQDADNFVFRALAETAVGANRDQILDFEQGLDLIVVAGLSPGVFEFRGTAAFAPSGNPELRLFETPTGSTIVQLDADGDGNADAEIRVADVTGLTANDFVL